MRAASPILFVFTVALTVTVFGDPENSVAVQKRGTLTTISGALSTSVGIAGNVATLLGLTTSAIPVLGIFTSLFGFIISLTQNDAAFWKKVEDKMREVAKDEIYKYNDVLAKGFIQNIKRSMGLFNRFPATRNGAPNQQKITEGISLSGDINNNQMWVNVELGRNPQKMIFYFMEVISIDVLLLYNMAIAYGSKDRGHWIRLDERLGHHIKDAETAANKVMTWRLGKLSCAGDKCVTSYRRCGPKGASRCANEAACYKGIDTLRTVCTRTSRRTPGGGTQYRQTCSHYSQKKTGSTNCNWFVAQVRATTQDWLNKNVLNYVNKWKDLKRRAARAAGRR